MEQGSSALTEKVRPLKSEIDQMEQDIDKVAAPAAIDDLQPVADFSRNEAHHEYKAH